MCPPQHWEQRRRLVVHRNTLPYTSVFRWCDSAALHVTHPINLIALSVPRGASHSSGLLLCSSHDHSRDTCILPWLFLGSACTRILLLCLLEGVQWSLHSPISAQIFSDELGDTSTACHHIDFQHQWKELSQHRALGKGLWVSLGYQKAASCPRSPRSSSFAVTLLCVSAPVELGSNL